MAEALGTAMEAVPGGALLVYFLFSSGVCWQRGGVMEAPSGERFSLIVYIAMAALVAVVPWFRGGLSHYPHLLLWEAVLLMLVATYWVRYRGSRGDMRRWRLGQWAGLWMALMLIRH
jgi:hypothetical protein